MKLRLVNDKRFTEPFARFLTKAIKLRIQSDKNIKKMAPFGEMLKKLDVKSTPEIVVERALKEIKYRKIESIEETGYEIYLDEDAMFDNKYKVIDLSYNYSNSSYNTKKGDSKEVLIINY